MWRSENAILSASHLATMHAAARREKEPDNLVEPSAVMHAASGDVAAGLRVYRWRDARPAA
jgi:hypothetical protein